MNAMFGDIVTSRNITDLSFMILNAAKYANHVNKLRERVSFPVYQEEPNQGLWSSLGKKDDFLIYDHCGRFAYYLTLPHSNILRYKFVRYFLLKTHRESPCGKCVKPTPMTTTTATDPPTNFTTANQNATIIITLQAEHENGTTSQATQVQGNTNEGKKPQD